MRASVEYVEGKFDEFNALMFGGELPKLPFKISSARSFLGQIRFVKKRNPDGSWHYHNFSFHISNRLDLPEKIVEDTIIHEMIHYFIGYKQLQDNAPHGKLFRKMMTDINKAFNRNISISHKASKEESDSDLRQRNHMICISRFRNGCVAITVSANNRNTLAKIWNQIGCLGQIEDYKWFYTTDPYFNRIPRSRNAKFYRIPADELRPHLAEVRELLRQGNSIMLSKTIDLSSWI